MQYELNVLQELIADQLSGSSTSEPTPMELESWQLIAREQGEMIKRKWVAEVFSLKKEKYIEVYIQHHQSSLIHLADQLLSYSDMAEAVPAEDTQQDITLGSVRKAVYQVLDELLSFMEKHFTKYFDQNTKIPDRYKLVSTQEMQARLQSIRSRFDHPEALHSLVEIATKPLQEFVNSPLSHPYTFRQLLYLKLLSEELQALELQGEESAQKRQLMNLLAYLNFNSFHFFDYYVDSFLLYIREGETRSEQIERLAYLRKEVNQLRLKPGVALKDKHDSIKTQLQEWINEEIYFLQSRKQLTAMGTDSVTEEDKLKVNLSVNQLAYFIRLQVEAHILPKKDLSQLFRFLSQHVQTKQAENITSESIRTKYYNVELGTKEKLKELLIAMLNIIRMK
jgi:hypothetical protein